MGNKYNPYFNQSGYADPTAYHAIKEASKDERMREVIRVLKSVAHLSGFEIVEIQIKRKERK